MAERIETEIDTTTSKGGKKIVAQNGDEEDIGSSPNEDEIDIEVEDDTPEEDRGRPARAPGTKSAIPEDEEIGQYTKGVQERLKQMKWEYHEERRQKEAWERQSNEAVAFAKKVHEENKKLRELVTKGHKTLLDSTKGAAESEMAAIQESLKAALETGNTSLAAELQGKLAKAAARAEAQNHIQPISFPEEEKQTQQTQQQDQPQRVRLSTTMQNWMDENPWFNQDKRMTAFAFGVHEELIEKGIPPESPRYFSEINKAMKESFPKYFEEDDGDTRNGRRTTTNGKSSSVRGTNVAGVVRRSAAGGKPKVTLTQSQLAVAKKMGIPPQLYAQELLRLEEQDG